MDSSHSVGGVTVLTRQQPNGRLVSLLREQFIPFEYDDLAMCLMAADVTTDVQPIFVSKDDVSGMTVKSRGRSGWQVSNTSSSGEVAVGDFAMPVALAADTPLVDDWVTRLSTPGRAYDVAVAQLLELMLRAARSQVNRMRETSVLGAVRREEIIQSSANEATMAVLSRLSTFEGRSAFTTWAYKFGIFHAGTEVRRAAWRDREVNLDDVPEPHQTIAPSPEVYAEGRDLAQAVRDGLRDALTPHQRRVAVAVLIDEVPIDVLAERLGINRGALYKTLHDARQRLRAHLSAHDFLLPVANKEEVTK